VEPHRRTDVCWDPGNHHWPHAGWIRAIKRWRILQEPILGCLYRSVDLMGRPRYLPASWYSWRHQLHALAEAGSHAIAPDMRGYGQTDRPEAIDQYTLLHLTGDMVGVLDALGTQTAVIAGHDWGGPVAWHAALLRPDRFNAVIGLSVPFVPRRPAAPTSMMPQTENAVFYHLYFQAPGVAEAELEHDVRRSIRSLLYSASGNAPRSTHRVHSLGMLPRSIKADARFLPLALLR
jgi:pimeloyl-ACP methyl ester carboxylesterase